MVIGRGASSLSIVGSCPLFEVSIIGGFTVLPYLVIITYFRPMRVRKFSSLRCQLINKT